MHNMYTGMVSFKPQLFWLWTNKLKILKFALEIIKKKSNVFSSEIKEISLVFQWFWKISLSFPQSEAPVELIH